MKLHLSELELAREYHSHTSFEALTPEQLRRMGEHAQRLHKWVNDHSTAHHTISLAVVVFLLWSDLAVLLALPAALIGHAGNGPSWIHSPSWIEVAAAVAVGALHSLLIYSMMVYSLHEGAAHKRIFRPHGPITRALAVVANNLSRLGAADPVYYAKNHSSHHSQFGTAEDGEFLNFVSSRRYWPTLLPFAMFLNYSDFVVHRPVFITRPLLRSMAVSLAYHCFYAGAMVALYGVVFPFVALVLVTPHVGFFVDRLRHFSEHNLMPLDYRNGARSFGLGFWGMLIGGGPWGQPCHLIHHMFPAVPWYAQLILYRKLKPLLSDRQREQFLLRPIIGFRLMYCRLLREPRRFAQSSTVRQPPG